MVAQSGLSVLQEIGKLWSRPLADVLSQDYLQRDVDIEQLTPAEIAGFKEFPAKSAQDHDIDFLKKVLECAKLESDPARVIGLLDGEVDIRDQNNLSKNPLVGAPHYMARDANGVLKYLREPHGHGKPTYKTKQVNVRSIKTLGKKSKKAEHTRLMVDPNWKPEVRDEEKKSKGDGLVLDRVINGRIGKPQVPTGKRPACINKPQARNSERGS